MKVCLSLVFVLTVGLGLTGCGPAEPEGYLPGDESEAAKAALQEKSADEAAGSEEPVAEDGGEPAESEGSEESPAEPADSPDETVESGE